MCHFIHRYCGCACFYLNMCAYIIHVCTTLGKTSHPNTVEFSLLSDLTNNNS
jgi:hypothetical protein